MIIRTVNTFEKAGAGKVVRSYPAPFEWEFPKKTTVTVIYTGNILRKLSFINLLAPPGPDATEAYYFDSTGRLVCHVDRTTGTPYYEVYQPPYVIQYAGDGDSANHILRHLDAQEALSNAKFIVDFYLSNGAIYNYTSFDLSSNRMEILTVKKSLALRERASGTAPLLETLRKGTTLIYLDRSMAADSVSGVGRWVWYKVKMKSGKIGWVWGFPTGLERMIDD
jgi:hypothetical protein